MNLNVITPRGTRITILSALAIFAVLTIVHVVFDPDPSLPATDTVTTVVPGWSSWTKRTRPIHSGPHSLVGDPSVIRDGDRLRMAYTCYDTAHNGPSICQATSTDGLTWTDTQPSGPPAGLMIRPRPGKWDDTHETPLLLRHNGEDLLYFSGYRDRGGFFKSFPAHLGLATSRDGINFERVSDGPILSTSPGGYDADAIFSPSIVAHEGELIMVYSGYCFDTCTREKGVYLMAATSHDGRSWTKRETPILSKTDFPSTSDGIAETALVKGPDGMFYLFTSLLYGKNGHEIGIARSNSPYGPWDIAPAPIIAKSPGGFDAVGPIAPSVLIEDGKARMWFHGFSHRSTIEIGYAEAAWPLRLK